MINKFWINGHVAKKLFILNVCEIGFMAITFFRASLVCLLSYSDVNLASSISDQSLADWRNKGGRDTRAICRSAKIFRS